MSDNIAALKAAFEAADRGDAGPLVNLYSDDLTWAGFYTDGTQRVYTKGEFLQAFGVLAKLDESANEITDAVETRDGLVTATLRILRRKGDVTLDTEMIMTHRFEDGKITRGADMVPAQFEQFWERVGISA